MVADLVDVDEMNAGVLWRNGMRADEGLAIDNEISQGWQRLVHNDLIPRRAKEAVDLAIGIIGSR